MSDRTVCFALLPAMLYELSDPFEEKCMCTGVGFVELLVI